MIKKGQKLYQYVYDGMDILEHDCQVLDVKPAKRFRDGQFHDDYDDMILTVSRIGMNYRYYVHEKSVDVEPVTKKYVYIAMLTEPDREKARHIFEAYLIERKMAVVEEMEHLTVLLEHL